MSEATVQVEIRERGPGDVQVSGELVFATVAAALPVGAGLIRAETPVQFDVSAVGRGDSAGVALLLEWRRIARERRADLRFVGAAEQLRTIAITSNLQDLFEGPDGDATAPADRQ